MPAAARPEEVRRIEQISVLKAELGPDLVSIAYYETEIVPLMRRMLRVNDEFGLPVLAFRDYVCSNGDVIRQDGTRVPSGIRGSG